MAKVKRSIIQQRLASRVAERIIARMNPRVNFLFSLRRAFASFLALATAAALTAQEVAVTVANLAAEPSSSIAPEPSAWGVDIPPLPEDAEVEPPLPAAEESQPAAGAASAEQAITSSPRRFQYAFQLTVRGIHDDNINLDHVDPISDYYVTIDPVIVLAFGDAALRQENFVRFDYRPRIFFFAEHSDNNAVQHVIRLEGQYSLRRLKIHASQEVQLLDGSEVDIRGVTGIVSNRVNLDVSGRTELNLYTTQVDATYDLTGKMFLAGGVSYVKSDYPSFISSDVFAGNISLNYHYSPKLDVGLGGAGGVTRVDAPNPDQTHQQINAYVTYIASGKLSFRGSGGVEFREFEGSNQDTHVSPVFAIGATYKPFDGTTMTLSAARNTYASAVLAGQDFTNTSVSITMRQRLLRRITLGLNAGYENSEYFSTVAGVTATRTDNYFFVQPGIDVAITRFWTVGAFYLYRRSDSTPDIFAFHANQVGVQSSLTF